VPDRVDRRTFIERATATAGALTLPGMLGATAARAAAATRAPIGLPAPAQVRADMTRMIKLGSRYTGTAGHGQYIDWLEEELVAAGVTMLPRDDFPLTIWEAQKYGLDLLDGPRAGAVSVNSYFPRSQETPAAGITGRLVYAGVAPLPPINGDIEGVQSALAAYPAQLGSWLQGLTGTLTGLGPGSIMLVDLPMPLPLVVGALLPLATHLNWTGHSVADWVTSDFKRTPLAPGVVALPLAPFKALGAAGVVFVLDASAEAIKGAYMPFENGFQEIPGLFVDRDTGTLLRGQAAANRRVRLTLTAKRREGTSPALLGYIKGDTDEALVLDTHTDGEGFVEENGGIGLVALARHFGSLPAGKRLKRTLVFSLWPGHMAAGMPQLDGVLKKHPDIVRGAAAAITVEHLGCTEWNDTVEQGYHATGEPETMFAWTTQGRMFEVARDALTRIDLPRTALMRPPVQFGVGGAFQNAGVPQIGFLASPYYLLTDTPEGDLDKLDEKLAAKQIAWVAELLTRLDAEPAAGLATGDPTLGKKTSGATARYATPPALRFGAKLTPTTLLRLRREGALRGSVSLNRIGLVRVHAALEHAHGRQRVTTTLGELLVRVPTAGAQPFELALSPRGLASVRHAKAGRVVLTARFRQDGAAHVRRARRRLVSS
jgi:hypothetical protein